MRQRDNITSCLSERVLARLRREYPLVASEVWVDDDHRVDFVAFKPESFSPGRSSPTPSSIERGEFVFVEVKSCMADFKSGHGLTFGAMQTGLSVRRVSPNHSTRRWDSPMAQRYSVQTLGVGCERNSISASAQELSHRTRLRAPVSDGEPQLQHLADLTRCLRLILPVVLPIQSQALGRYRYRQRGHGPD